MTQHTNPQFADILNLLNALPQMPENSEFTANSSEPLTWIDQWLAHNSYIYDFSKGFDVNRCALYWAGYNMVDGFDGQAFVDACQDQRGSLRSLAAILDTDLQIFELNPSDHSQPSADELALAASYGMMAIEESTQLFCATSFGQGVQATSQNIIETLNKTDSFDLETFMTAHCGLDHAALLGNAIAAIMKGIPFIIEGAQGTLIQSLLFRATDTHFGNIIVTHDLTLPANALPGHAMISTAIMLKTLFAGSRKSACGKIKTAAA